MGDEPPIFGAALKWKFVARAKGYKCINCGAVPSYEDHRYKLNVDLIEEYLLPGVEHAPAMEASHTETAQYAPPAGWVSPDRRPKKKPS
jgi:hypothetical protein